MKFFEQVLGQERQHPGLVTPEVVGDSGARTAGRELSHSGSSRHVSRAPSRIWGQKPGVVDAPLSVTPGYRPPPDTDRYDPMTPEVLPPAMLPCRSGEPRGEPCGEAGIQR